MKKYILSLFITFIVANSALAQIKDFFTYNGRKVNYLAQNNHRENNFDYPGMRAYIIIEDFATELISAYAKDEFRTIKPQLTTGFTAFFYLKAEEIFTGSDRTAVLQNFTEHINRTYFIDPNRIHLVIKSNNVPLECDTLSATGTFLASINAAVQPEHVQCGKTVKPLYDIQRVFTDNLNARTSVSYPLPGYEHMTRAENEKRSENITAAIRGDNKSWSFDLTVGNFKIREAHRTVLDTLTGVNLANYHTLYNLQAGLRLKRRIGIFGTLGFIYSGKQKNIQSIDNDGGRWTVRATGTAGLMFRYGLALNVTALTLKRWKFDVSLAAGGLKAITGGGDATKTIGGGGSLQKNIEKQKESTVFLSPAINARYYFGKSFYFTNNLQYTRAPFSEPIGSVTAFSGYAVNFGFGFSFYSNRHRNE